MHVLALLALFCLVQYQLFAESYEVKLEGIEDKTLQKAFRRSSQIFSQKDKAAPTAAALKRRAINDQEKLLDLAKYYGFYSAKVTYTIQHTDPIQVIFRVELGPKYLLDSFTIDAIDHQEAMADISSKTVHLEPGKPIDTQAIVSAEKALLWEMKKRGYALCQVLKKECVANLSKHTLSVTFIVMPGQKISFGKTSIVGHETILGDTIAKNIMWNEGQTFDPATVEDTQNRLEKSGLFSSVIITQEQEKIENDQMPIQIHVQESKHHSIGAGIAYSTSFGPGIKAEWANKNLRGMAEKLVFRAELWEKYHTVLLSLTKPHFKTRDQDLIWVAEYDKLHTVAFDSISYNLSAMIQTRISGKLETMQGLRAEWLDSKNFEGHNLFQLVKVPLQVKWSNANNLLDPTKGQTLNIKVTPSTNFVEPSFFYCIHTTSLSGYQSFKDNKVTLAAKVVLGNILGAARHTIPPPDRFYGGSENVLRGFRAYTVSPLHDKRIPVGGRSILAGSLETRFRSSGDLGWVFFYDIGNVYTTNMPKFQIHQFHSVGTGVRYATPIGPLRFDVAVPLNRRPNIDPRFQIYFSIGQAF